ncbi:nucleotidyltransferase domain-containing protein [Sphingomonas colocasiae]|uniref:Nucleotidyltransferase family protein n=1 Tax=Sphingomonas colocasiae TaxID=1848973 RepID=A0ABS7PHY1_9SPHN|nr:nucleotidyltransferase family protein [Sphingomonas colocasiae]MBY8820896.1 nucleotidyltransferase family protein [Sphingomonas colocasiae]
MREPATTATLDAEGWTSLFAAARAEQMIGSLAFRLEAQPMPAAAARILADARASAEQWRRSALWEAEMARRALAQLDLPVVLMKGTAYAAAGMDAGAGRSIGDLDIMVPREALKAAETALIAAGWEWVKPDPYDDAYYRDHMHELPPLIHRERDRMIDVHHTTLPLTARITPDAAAMLADSVVLEDGLRIMAPEDMVLHGVAHLFADGDLAGGLRNLWDQDRLLRELGVVAGFWDRLRARARLHGLEWHLALALRLTRHLYATPVDPALAGRAGLFDRWFVRRLLARDGWGRQTRKFTQLAFYIRSHWLRMPPAMLARHLWTKWRKAT